MMFDFYKSFNDSVLLDFLTSVTCWAPLRSAVQINLPRLSITLLNGKTNEIFPELFSYCKENPQPSVKD